MAAGSGSRGRYGGCIVDLKTRAGRIFPFSHAANTVGSILCNRVDYYLSISWR